MENQTLLFCFLIMVFILYIITIKKENGAFTDYIDIIQKRQIQELKQKLKK
jgi:hypothetical protein